MTPETPRATQDVETRSMRRGRAVAVRYPVTGELEQALADTGGIRVDAIQSVREWDLVETKKFDIG